MMTSSCAILSPTVMRGKTVQRMCTINPRTTRAEIETMIAKLHEIGKGLSLTEDLSL